MLTPEPRIREEISRTKLWNLIFCFRQIDLDLATKLGLLGHQRFFGRSQVANGSDKVDYLCPVEVSISGVTRNIVVKVAPSQPLLLGLDAMHAFDMELSITKRKFSIAGQDVPPPVTSFRLLEKPNSSASLESRKMSWYRSRCVRITNYIVSADGLTQTLPPIGDAWIEASKSGKACLAIDLGVSFTSTIIGPPPRAGIILDLGVAY